MRLGVRQKLVLGALATLIVVSFSFSWLQIRLSRTAFEEDLRARGAIPFAREVAATIDNRHELENGARLERQIRKMVGARPPVLHLEIITFSDEGARVVATSNTRRTVPFTRADAEQVRSGQVVSRLVVDDRGRSYEVMAPVSLEGAVAGAIVIKYSLDRADVLAARIRNWALALTAVSVVVMGLLMAVGVHVVVNRPIQRFMEAVRSVQRGDQSAVVRVDTSDEFGLLARHFNHMMMRIRTFNEELQARIKEATGELEERYREVERLQEVLFRMQRNLGHAERLALAGQIMAEVAHEVGTPLHSVAGHLELLRQDLPPEALCEPVTRRLSIIEGQLCRVTDIITQLLDLTRRGASEPVAVELNRLVRDTADLVRPGLAAASLKLELDPDSTIPAVRGHPNQLQQVVLNLLTNAMDATPAGGTIRVSTRSIDDDAHVELEVADSGRGIPATELKQIFEPFFSTKESGRGTGLGLFISAEIVREHKGRIDVVSEEGRGSTFKVRLPAVAAA